MCPVFNLFLLLWHGSSPLCKTASESTSREKGDIASKDFHKQWLESCDEAEKEAVYQSSYSTYIFSGKLIGILLVVTMIAHLFFNTGVFAIVVVGVIYLCITVKYCVSCVKLKNKS